jgi:S1-C subfamily serine protease
MPDQDHLAALSDSIAGHVAAAAPVLLAVRGTRGRALNAVAWRPDIAVTSEQALAEQDSYALTLADGTETTATPAGRDPGTNVALLRLARPAAPPATIAPAASPRVGCLVLVLASGVAGGPTAQLAMVSEVGPAWHSMAGGRIDRLLRLDLRAGRSAEGGLVIDAAGGVVGMAAAGPRGQMLVIPHATIAAAVDPLLAEGRIARGWLGLGMQPVAVPAALRGDAGQDRASMIVSIAAGGPAEQAGLMAGDIVLALDGRTDLDIRAIRALLGPERIGTPVAVRLARGGVVQSATLTIAARPAG